MMEKKARTKSGGIAGGNRGDGREMGRAAGIFSRQNAMLAVALVLIASAILYVESTKAGPQVRPSGNQVLPGQPYGANSDAAGRQEGYSPYPPAPELAGIAGYINAPPNLTIASLRGRVVLVDFWDYTCINCIRTLPYVESWYGTYANDGLEIIGVHTPEFDFEKNYSNLKTAVDRFGITYPVVQDNDYATWTAYQNSYWPHDYLIDAQGSVRYDHIGEGGYDETEQEIVQLLSEAKNRSVGMNSTGPNAAVFNPYEIGTPEIYFGQDFRRAPLGNAQPSSVGETFNAAIPQGTLQPNVPYLEGQWTNGADAVRLAGSSGAVELVFTAKNVNIVAGSANTTNLTLYIDGKRVEKQDYCPDAPKGACTVGAQRLYSIIELQGYGTHLLRMEANGTGLELFTFTFG